MQVPLIRLRCGVNSYEWGKRGADSAAARLGAATDLTIEPDKPYAELWMGTHPSNPSTDTETNRTLLDLCTTNASLISQPITAAFGPGLPFLFKVLSIHKALSIQAHPNKTLAAQLHARDPAHYPDANHKPEMAIALTPFEGLCGFRRVREVARFLDAVAPLRRLVGDENAVRFVRAAERVHDDDEEVEGEAGTEDAGDGAERSTHDAAERGKDAHVHDAEARAALKAAFAALMSSPPESIARETPALLALATTHPTTFAGPRTPARLAPLLTTLHTQFGADIGLFVLFFLNLVHLEPGEALFLVADDIHAYISGDIMECMATSDNVVRAGLSPKFKDVDTLVSMLTYAPGPARKLVPTPYPYATLNRAAYASASDISLYDPPIDEFAVVRTRLAAPAARAAFEPLQGPSIVICTQGRGQIAVGPTRRQLDEGFVYFVGAMAECVLESTGDDEFVAFRAFCELGHDKEKL